MTFFILRYRHIDGSQFFPINHELLAVNSETHGTQDHWRWRLIDFTKPSAETPRPPFANTQCGTVTAAPQTSRWM